MNRDTQDLDRLDRATLRAWRALNLVGWGAVGAVVTIALAEVASLVASRMSESSSLAANRLSLLSVLVCGAAGGAVVGARVYRFPGLVAFLGQELALAGWLSIRVFVDHVPMGPQELVIQMTIWLLVVLPAVLVARIVWRHRPTALRSLA
jgi:hypothetical protein